jgi:hypothetical protein
MCNVDLKSAVMKLSLCIVISCELARPQKYETDFYSFLFI